MERTATPDYEYTPETGNEIGLPAPDGSVSVVRYGEIIDFGGDKPEIIDGTMYAPLWVMARETGYDYEALGINYAAISNRAYGGSRSQTEQNTFYVRSGDSVIIGSDYDVILPAAPIELNG
jgi:hypothetical protein